MINRRPFTALEQDVFGLICEAQPELAAQLRPLLAAARMARRDNTGHGFYTYVETDPLLPAVEWPARMIHGPNRLVQVGEAEMPMGFILWLEHGRPDCLEGFQFGTVAGDIDLNTYDLNGLSLLGEWP